MERRIYESCSNDFAKYDIKINNDNIITVNGIITNAEIDTKSITYKACAPFERRFSFTGSGLPFFSHQQAFERNVSSGPIKIINQKFTISFPLPNSFYSNDILQKPTLYITFLDKKDGLQKTTELVLSESVPFRTLIHPEYKQDDVDIQSQWNILMSRAYPAHP